MDLPVPIPVLLVRIQLRTWTRESCSFSGFGLELDLAVAGYDTSLRKDPLNGVQEVHIYLFIGAIFQGNYSRLTDQTVDN